MSNFISLFSGAGGLDIGFINAGFTPIYATDNNADSVRTYNTSLGYTSVLADFDDIADSVSDLRAEIIIGGPPCQGFSGAKQSDLSDVRTSYVLKYLDVVFRVRPEIFVMENVPNLYNNNRFSVLVDSIMSGSYNAGYTVSLLFLNACDYGVPQRRGRVFLIGSKSGLVAIAPPVFEPCSVRQFLSRLPRFGEIGNDIVSPSKITPAKRPKVNNTAFTSSLFNGRGRPIDIDSCSNTITTMTQTHIIDQRHLDYGDEYWVVDYFNRLRSGGSPVSVVPDYLRRLTVQESSALQGFPSFMEWSGAVTSMYRQIGNAVPPPLGYSVACAVSKLLA